MVRSYIGGDVHCRITDLAVMRGQKVVQRLRVPTTIPALTEALAQVGGSKALTIEEGPMADWLYRNLRGSVDELIVCDPRRNRLISDDGDKSDPIDAAKLAELLRNGQLRAVHHGDSEDRVAFKQWVSLYHDRVREAVRQVNKIRARCRMHGLWPPRGFLSNPPVQRAWLLSLGAHPVVGQLSLLLVGLSAARSQVAQCRRELARRSRGYPVVGLWQELPGVGLIRAVTLLAYLDTPWRFRGPKALWKYCGVGLVRDTSGKDRKGRDRKGKLRLAWQVNRRLKDVVMGMAASVIRQGGNPFSDQYEHLVGKGMPMAHARHTVARRMLTVAWGMWKNQSRYDSGLAARG
jgi:transposase